MGQESFGMVRFDLEPLLQGQTRIAKLISAYNLLIIGPRGIFSIIGLEILKMKAAYRKSMAVNF